MIYKRIKLLIVVTLLFCIPIVGQKIIVKTDKFTSEKHLVCDLGFETAGTFFDVQGTVQMTIYAFPSPKDPIYSVMFWVSKKSFMFIKPGASLILKIDGEMLPLNSKTGSVDSRNVYRGSISEIASYDLTYENLVKISSAKTIEYRLTGSQGLIDWRFEPKAIQAFKSILDLLPANGAPWKIVGNTVTDDTSVAEVKKETLSDPIPKFNLTSELARLDKLKKDGLITAEDYELLKKRAVEKAKE